MPAIVSIYNHQEKLPLRDEFIAKLESITAQAVSLALKNANATPSALSGLEEVEVSFIDDETIADIHFRFMDIPGATDVITFDHGEIHISTETARSQAQQYGQSWEREMALYLIHGLLHLAGHEDASETGASTMARLQEDILSQLW